ncbi:MAG: hypothetical protein DMD96_15025 [Candidatus Rokuibacteriota bacterium]|nr:MAG: hypothetical protein DMD96_15025 [Candidatus Rokubacteria bacterium]
MVGRRAGRDRPRGANPGERGRRSQDRDDRPALESLARYFAVALAPRGITVNSVSPGLTDDSILSGFPQLVVDTARAWHASGWTPMERMGTPADIGNVVSLLCSPDAAWVTGQLIYADGGASLVDTLLTPLAAEPQSTKVAWVGELGYMDERHGGIVPSPRVDR